MKMEHRASSLRNLSDELEPLIARAKELQSQSIREQEAALQRWIVSEKPVLKEHAQGLKESMSILAKEETVLQESVDQFSTAAVPNHPGTTTGFNVIRSRIDTFGRPLSMEALYSEKERLTKALEKLNIDLASARSEITTQKRRWEEQEIWETKLVALQDTIRVYRDEINMIEVELLGREHYARVAEERRKAEESGTAQLRRIQEQLLQTRIKLNRAKQDYYFPKSKGYNITFGGGGIYGACKDIAICEINGGVSIHAEVGERSGEKVVSLIFTFHSAGVEKKSPQKKANGDTKRTYSEPPSPVKCSASNPFQASSMSLSGNNSMTPSSSQHKQTSKVRKAVTFPDKTSSGTQLTHPGPVVLNQSTHSPAVESLRPSPYETASAADKTKTTKQKNVAMRFLKRLGSRKDKFQGQARKDLEPVREEVGDAEGGKRRTLAGKLLSRGSKSSKRLDLDSSHHGGLSSLAFGGNKLHGGNLSARTESGYEDDEDDNASTSSGIERQESAGETSFTENTIERHSEGDGSLASEDEDYEEDNPATLTSESLHRQQQFTDPFAVNRGPGTMGGRSMGSSGGGNRSWLRGKAGSGGAAMQPNDTMSMLDDGTSSLGSFTAADSNNYSTNEDSAAGTEKTGGGCYVLGRLTGFDLVGERGTKVPNLTIGSADVKATVYVRMSFEYTKSGGWKPHSELKPLFDVQRLGYKIRGNNVPMPPSLIRQILRMAIPGLIQRRLLGVMLKEFGDYLVMAERAIDLQADVALVGPALGVLDSDLAFEVRGPATSAKGAKKQQSQYAAAKEARSLLGLSLPQAQVLSALFSGKNALVNPPGPVSIRSLITLQAHLERTPKVYKQVCQVINTAYQVITQGKVDPNREPFNFLSFMEGPLWKVRQKPAKARVIVRSMNIPFNADAIVTAMHDFTQRSLEEVYIKGPLHHPGETIEEARGSIEGELELLRAWHAFALRELGHFKSKFRGAGGTVLAAADALGFSAGIEHCFYEGPLKIRIPMAMQVDDDGAFSFTLPLPSPEGGLGVFIDNFKALTVPAHTRPPAAAVNWVELSGDTELDGRMRRQLQHAIGLITEVLQELGDKITREGLAAEDADPVKVLTQPRTKVGDRLGKLIVSRLQVKVRLDERRIGEILNGIDADSMGGGKAFIATAGRILGHLGDVMTLAFTPATSASEGEQPTDKYLFQFESSDISRLRADVASLGFQSLVTPGGVVRLLYALGRAFFVAFKGGPEEKIDALRASMQHWYLLMTREALDISVSVDTKGSVENGEFIVTLSGMADETALRATSPLVLTNELELVRLGKAMRGDGPAGDARNYI